MNSFPNIDEVLFLNASDPLSILGNGNKQDDILDEELILALLELQSFVIERVGAAHLNVVCKTRLCKGPSVKARLSLARK